MPNQQLYRKRDVSGGIQSATSHTLRKRNELIYAKNATFSHKIGAAARRLGYESVAVTQAGKESLGLHVHNYGANNRVLFGVNEWDDSFTTIRELSGSSTVELYSGIAANTKMQFLDHLEECYVVGATEDNVFMDPLNIKSLYGSLDVSTTRSLINAPKAKFIGDYRGSLYAVNVEVDGVHYPDRVYLSSPPLGEVTHVQTEQTGLLSQLRVDSVRYLKVGMTIDIYGAENGQRRGDSIVVTDIDKKNDRIGFNLQELHVKDNDEIWVAGTYGRLNNFWNTDYPTKESADFLRIESGGENKVELNGWTKSDNRFLIFTEDSIHKWDGGNLIDVSRDVGSVNHDTIVNIDDWVVFLSKKGVYGYNDNSGQLIRLSRPIANYVNAIKQGNYKYASAVGHDRRYKLAVGELLSVDANTTSTSTSSTSTSSTSSSTSSTSTSSTSTSMSSSSTSSTSSSTSASTTSTSTSSTSTSTTTAAAPLKVYRFVYDFDLDAWEFEVHRREIRQQLVHTMHGYTKPYFVDNWGNFFRDETGDTDNGETIPFELDFGRDTQGVSEYRKHYIALAFESEAARSARVFSSIGGGELQKVGQLTNRYETIKYQNDPKGFDNRIRILHNDPGERPIIDGPTIIYALEEARQ